MLLEYYAWVKPACGLVKVKGLNWPFLHYSGCLLWMQCEIPTMARCGGNTDTYIQVCDTCTVCVIAEPYTSCTSKNKREKRHNHRDIFDIGHPYFSQLAAVIYYKQGICWLVSVMWPSQVRTSLRSHGFLSWLLSRSDSGSQGKPLQGRRRGFI